MGLKLPSDGNGGRPAFDWQAIKDAQQAEADAEERRLFYVAMTRAQEHLILSGALPRRRRGARASRSPGSRGRWSATRSTGLTPEDPVRVAERARVRCVLNAPATVGEVLTAPAPEAPDPFAGPSTRGRRRPGAARARGAAARAPGRAPQLLDARRATAAAAIASTSSACSACRA